MGPYETTFWPLLTVQHYYPQPLIPLRLLALDRCHLRDIDAEQEQFPPPRRRRGCL